MTDAAPAPAITPPATPQPAAAAAPPHGAPIDAAAAPAGDAVAKPGDVAETKEQKTARLSAASKAARRAAARNRELTAQNQQLQQRAHLASQSVQTTDQQIAQLRELAQRDPLAFARQLGLDPKKVVEASVRESSPEAQLEARIAAAEEKAKAAEERAAKWEEQQQSTHQQELAKQAHAGFVQESGNATTYPNVAKMPAPARVAWAHQLLAEDRAAAARVMTPEQLRAYQPTNKQLLQHMERLAASNGAPPPKAQSTEASPDETKPGSTTPQTVTNALTAAKYTLPANFDSLSDREQKHHLARYLESLGGGKKKKSA